MKPVTLHLAAWLGSLLLATTLGLVPAQADQLDDIRKAGVVRVAVFDSNPPFGSIDPKTRDLVGYDIDFAQAIAKRLGVRAELVPTNPANRIPLLQSRAVDIIVADITITPERAQVIDFSHPYFVTGQQLLAGAAGPQAPAAFATARIGAVKGTTGEQNIRKQFPQARVLSYDDLPAALVALRNGQVQAITQDGPVLVGLLAVAPDAAKYRILPHTLTTEDIGIGVRKGEPRLLREINEILLALEQNEEAPQIYDRWFGSGAKVPQPRSFKIAAR